MKIFLKNQKRTPCSFGRNAFHQLLAEIFFIIFFLMAFLENRKRFFFFSMNAFHTIAGGWLGGDFCADFFLNGSSSETEKRGEKRGQKSNLPPPHPLRRRGGGAYGGGISRAEGRGQIFSAATSSNTPWKRTVALELFPVFGEEGP